ncbi:MAG: OmpA family protein [Chitinophagaceae bacterium]
MKKLHFCIPLLLCYLSNLAQAPKGIKEDGKMATVNVVMTNSKKLPQKGEEIIFVAAGTSKTYNAKTDAHGKSSLRLPPGDDYTIKLKTMQDTTQYTMMNIPPLAAGQFFTAPFTVTIQYDPPVNFTLDNVQFDVGQATLRSSSFKQLDELADYLRWKEGQAVEIAGHTDNTGVPADNVKLSQRRSETVKAWLVKKGIPASRITAKGYGDTQPMADNKTAEGRQQNRRTEARLKDGS